MKKEQKHIQSVPITNDVVGSNLDQDVVYNIICDKVCQWLVTGRWFCSGPPVSSTNKTDRNDITEILLKVAFKHYQTNKQNNKQKKSGQLMSSLLLFKCPMSHGTLDMSVILFWWFGS
jgi:hypothetical protein